MKAWLKLGVVAVNLPLVGLFVGCSATATKETDPVEAGVVADAQDGATTPPVERVLSTDGYAYKAGKWQLVARQVHEYEGTVRVRTKSSFSEDETTWTEVSTTTYDYENGLLVSTRTKTPGSSLYIEDETKNFYDSNNRLTRKESGYLERAGVPWVWDTRVALRYDDLGRLTTEESEHLFSTKQQWVPEMRTTHEYSPTGVRTGTRVYLYALKRDGERHAFEYDAQGRLASETVYRLPNAGEEVPEKRFVSHH